MLLTLPPGAAEHCLLSSVTLQIIPGLSLVPRCTMPSAIMLQRQKEKRVDSTEVHPPDGP